VEAVETGHDEQGSEFLSTRWATTGITTRSSIWRCRLPGVLTLHDVVLHHLLLDVTLGRGLFDPYVERLTQDHGWVGQLPPR